VLPRLALQENLVIITAIVGAVTGVASLALRLLDYRKKAKADVPKFRFETFVESIGQTGQTVRKIRVLHPNKMLERCRVLFNGTPLIWDGVNRTIKTIEEGGGGNVVVPENIFDEGAEVVLESNGKVIRRAKYKDLEMVEP
jgi:hypothetical protein